MRSSIGALPVEASSLHNAFGVLSSASGDVPEDCASALSLRSQFQNPHAVHFRLKMRPGWGSLFNYPKH
jgi:hypothetical protein